jgi:uncharacterized protein
VTPKRSQWLLLIVVLILASPTHPSEPKFPPLTGRVVDDAGVLSASTKSQLTDMLDSHEAATGEQVVVVTLKSLQEYTIEDYGYQLGRYWGIGQKGVNNGALLIVAPKEHKVRIEVGYGLEGTLTDALSATIIQNYILPSFKRGDFNAGVVAGTTEVLLALGGNPLSPAPVSHRAANSASNARAELAILIFAVPPFLFILLFVAALLKSFIDWLLHHNDPKWLAERRAALTLERQYFAHERDYGGGKSSSWGGGGDGGGGGFSGGGGSFGGGGASGSW